MFDLEKTDGEETTSPGGVRGEDNATHDAAQTPEAPAPAHAEPKSDVETILERATKDLRYKMIVSELPNFDVDGREDAAAEREYCMTISPVTLDYLEAVAGRFGGGVYLFELHERGKGFVKGGRWTERIKRAKTTDREQTAAPALPVAAPVEKSDDPIRKAMEAAMASRIAHMFEDPKPPVAAPVEKSDDPIRNAIDAAIAEKVKHLFDAAPAAAPVVAGAASSTIADIAALAEAVGLRQILVPVGSIIAQGIAQSMAQKTQQGSAPPTQPQPGGAARSSHLYAVPPAVPPPDEDKSDMQIVLEDAMADMLQAAPVDKAAEDISEVIAGGNSPALAQLLALPTQELLATLLEGHEQKQTILANAGHVRWWDELKAAIEARGGAA